MITLLPCGGASSEMPGTGGGMLSGYKLVGEVGEMVKEGGPSESAEEDRGAGVEVEGTDEAVEEEEVDNEGEGGRTGGKKMAS